MLHGVAVGPLHAFGAGDGADEHEQRRFGQMEIGDDVVDDFEPVARRDENVGFAGKGCRIPLSSAALSSKRKEVVPTAIMRLPFFFASFIILQASGEMTPYSACILWSLVSSTLTGRKVPAPTCRVRKTF